MIHTKARQLDRRMSNCYYLRDNLDSRINRKAKKMATWFSKLAKTVPKGRLRGKQQGH